MLVRRRLPWLVIVALVGAVLGTTTALLNHSTTVMGAVLSQIFGIGWSWLVLGFICALSASRWRASIAQACTSLWTAVFTYYLTDFLQGEYRSEWTTADGQQLAQTDWLGVVADCAVWLIIATTAGTLIGIAARLARSERVLVAAVVRVCVPLAVIWAARINLRYSIGNSTESAARIATTGVTITAVSSLAVIIVSSVVSALRVRAR